MINTAIIGFGLSGRIFHAPFIHTHKGFKLAKVVQRHGNSANDLYPEVTVVHDYRELLKDDSIELVIICTPNIDHYDMAVDCLNAGKNIVVEKPFMPTVGEADRVIELAEAKNLKVFVYQNRRWDGDFLTIRQLLKSDLLGTIDYYEAHFDRFSPERKRAAWRDDVLPGSGILYDLGSHLIDQALCLFGNPETVIAKIEQQRPGSRVDDFFEVSLKYPNMKAVLTAGMLVEHHELRYKINGSMGTFVKYGIDPQESFLKAGDMPVGEDWGTEPEKNFGKLSFKRRDVIVDGSARTLPGNYMGFYQNVYDVIKKGAEQDVKPAEARNTIRIIELAFESSLHNKEIPF